MIKTLTFAVLLTITCSMSLAQNRKAIDSLRSYSLTARQDTAKIDPLLDLAQRLLSTKPDTTVILARQALLLARQNKLTRYEVKALYYLSFALAFTPKEKDTVMLCMQQAFSLARQNKLLEEEVGCFTVLSQIYVFIWQKPDSGILLAYQGMALADKYKLISQKIGMVWPLINGYIQLKKTDSALQICLDWILISKQNKFPNSEKQFSGFVSYIISRSSVDTARLLTEKAIAWAIRKHEKKYEASFRTGMALNYMNANNYPEALKAFMTVLETYKNLDDKPGEAEVLDNIGEIYRQQSEYRQALLFFLKKMEIQKGLRDSMIMYTYEKIGYNYAKSKMHDSAIYFAEKSYQEAATVGAGDVPGGVLDDLGELYFELGEDSIAMNYFQESLLKLSGNVTESANLGEIYIGIAKLYKKRGQIDSSFHYAGMALPLAQQNNQLNYIIDASSIISGFYKSRHQIDSAFVYQEIASSIKDSLFSREKIKEIQKIAFDEQIRQRQVEEAQAKYRSRVRSYILFGGLAIVLLIAGILFRNNRQKQKTNKKLEKTLSDLKATQSQLIQSEKMASLGELTAGIAHEIQNPLNFVNNFSEVNKELIEEVKSQKSLSAGQAGKLKSEEIDELLNDIAANEEKINHHGKRADAIVKGMLQHSRSSSGQKELTDINALAGEYLRLAYHGLRAKDKDFNVTVKTDYDETIGKINIIPQDIGRVILNLLTNAFYAVSEKQEQNIPGYEPTVSVSTRTTADKFLISVKDNGGGIPQKALDKIFQPFFTTKPTGQGTGLGLSLAYDIVKAHGGELKVETNEGEGTEFIIQLPGN